MSNINSTLNRRGSKYGPFEDNANMTQSMLAIIEKSPNYKDLPTQHKEAFHMIFHKISRAVCGDPMYADNAHDIAGYASLLEKYINQENGVLEYPNEIRMTIQDIRKLFIHLKNKLGDNFGKPLEIINASFIANGDAIFGELNLDYAQREVQWYHSKSLQILDMKGRIPEIWKQIMSSKGEVNSNYGWCIFSKENGNQYQMALKTLAENRESRRATMIYTRPSMHEDFCKDGMNDFICTNTVQLFIRSNRLEYIVNMRSNDAIYGYKNDVFWHMHVHKMCLSQLQDIYPELLLGDLLWNANSLHIYPNHFDLIK